MTLSGNRGKVARLNSGIIELNSGIVKHESEKGVLTQQQINPMLPHFSRAESNTYTRVRCKQPKSPPPFTDFAQETRLCFVAYHRYCA